MNIAIVGYGFVGKHVQQLFPDAAIYDPPKQIGTREAVNDADVAFVCVPTPAGEDGRCDTSAVEAVCAWLETPLIVLRSTVPVGTTDRLRITLDKRIIFQPEFVGMTPAHPYAAAEAVGWAVLGGPLADTAPLAALYQQHRGADFVIHQTAARTAELVKYATNAYLALKIGFCSELYDLAEVVGVDYTDLREHWLLDPRIGRSHTAVYPQDRGFGGACLPKDTAALLAQADLYAVDMPLLRTLIAANAARRTGTPV